VDKALRQVEQALRAGVTTPITFEPDWVPPPALKPGILIPPLKARLRVPRRDQHSGQNLDTGQTIYDSNTKFVLSGMSHRQDRDSWSRSICTLGEP